MRMDSIERNSLKIVKSLKTELEQYKRKEPRKMGNTQGIWILVCYCVDSEFFDC